MERCHLASIAMTRLYWSFWDRETHCISDAETHCISDTESEQNQCISIGIANVMALLYVHAQYIRIYIYACKIHRKIHRKYIHNTL